MTDINTNWDRDPYDDEEELPVKPVKVHIVADTTEVATYTANYGGYQTFSIPQAGPLTIPVQVLQRRPKRHRALLEIVALGGATGIVFNKMAEALVQVNPLGYTLEVAGTTREIKNQEQLYMVAIGGGPATVSVLDESWE